MCQAAGFLTKILTIAGIHQNMELSHQRTTKSKLSNICHVHPDLRPNVEFSPNYAGNERFHSLVETKLEAVNGCFSCTMVVEALDRFPQWAGDCPEEEIYWVWDWRPGSAGFVLKVKRIQGDLASVEPSFSDGFMKVFDIQTLAGSPLSESGHEVREVH